MRGAVAVHSRPRRGGNGHRQRSTPQTHGLQQLARDKALSTITVLLRPILYACPMPAVSLKVLATCAEPYASGLVIRIHGRKQ